MTVADYAAVLGVWLLAITAPGPDVVLVLRESVRNGRTGAVAAAAGIVAGIAVWLALAMTGAHLLLEADHRLLGGLQLLGGGYLVFLGIGALQAARTAQRGNAGLAEAPGVIGRASSGAGRERSGRAASLRRGALTNLSNPKALVFFGTVFSVLVPAETATIERVLLSIVLVAVSGVWFGSLAWLSSSDRVGSFLTRHAAVFDAITGVAFVVLGGVAAATGFDTLVG